MHKTLILIVTFRAGEMRNVVALWLFTDIPITVNKIYTAACVTVGAVQMASGGFQVEVLC